MTVVGVKRGTGAGPVLGVRRGRVGVPMSLLQRRGRASRTSLSHLLLSPPLPAAEVPDPAPASCGRTSASRLPAPPFPAGVVLATAVSLLPGDPSSRDKCGPFIPFTRWTFLQIPPHPVPRRVSRRHHGKGAAAVQVQRRLDPVSALSRVISAS